MGALNEEQNNKCCLL